MLARLTSGFALASMAALVLVGCTPDEPSVEEVAIEVEATYNGFQGVLAEQLPTGALSASALEPFATPAFAESFTSDLQAILDSGVTTSGTPVVTLVEVADHTPDHVAATICTDDREVETVTAEGETVPPTGLTAWDAELVRSEPGEPLVIDSLELIPDETICGP